VDSEFTQAANESQSTPYATPVLLDFGGHLMSMSLPSPRCASPPSHKTAHNSLNMNHNLVPPSRFGHVYSLSCDCFGAQRKDISATAKFALDHCSLPHDSLSQLSGDFGRVEIGQLGSQVFILAQE